MNWEVFKQSRSLQPPPLSIWDDTTETDKPYAVGHIFSLLAITNITSS